MLKGYYNYYGVNGNYEQIKRFYEAIRRLLYKWLNRRSQRRSWKSYEEFRVYLEKYPLPGPRITVNIWA